MSDDYPPIDCGKCADRAWAQSMCDDFQSDAGRHVSTDVVDRWRSQDDARRWIRGEDAEQALVNAGFAVIPIGVWDDEAQHGAVRTSP